MPKSIPTPDLVKIVGEAGQRFQREGYERSVSRLVDPRRVSIAKLATAYDLAQTLGIPKEHVEAAIAARYPSAEDQLQALEAHHAVATTRAAAETYRSNLLAALHDALPQTGFKGTVENSSRLIDAPHVTHKWRRDWTVRLVRVDEKAVPLDVQPGWRNLFGLWHGGPRYEIEQAEAVLALIDVGNEWHPGVRFEGPMPGDLEGGHRGERLHIVVTVASGSFIAVCSRVLEELRQRFDRHNGVAHHAMIYDYVVD